jgi:hypothetical protein
LHCEPTTHIVIEAGDATFVPIDPTLARRFNITENIWAHQFATKKGIHIIFTKNKAAGSGYQANPADDSEDSGLDYQHYEHEQIHTA